MERFTGKVPGPNNKPVPATFDMSFVFGLSDKTYKAFMAMVARLYEYEETGLTPQEIHELKTLAEHHKEGRLLVVPCHGEVLYEADGEHGVVKHSVTDLHWVANTMAQDDHGMVWADYYTDEEIETAHPTREAAEAALAKLED